MCYLSHNANHSLATFRSIFVGVRREKNFQADDSLHRDVL